MNLRDYDGFADESGSPWLVTFLLAKASRFLFAQRSPSSFEPN